LKSELIQYTICGVTFIKKWMRVVYGPGVSCDQRSFGSKADTD